MTLQDAERELEWIRATAQDLGEVEKAERGITLLYVNALEGVLAGTISHEVIKKVLMAQVIQVNSRRVGYEGC